MCYMYNYQYKTKKEEEDKACNYFDISSFFIRIDFTVDMLMDISYFDLLKPTMYFAKTLECFN